MRRELAAARGETVDAPPPNLRSVPKVDEDLIPDVLTYERSEEDIQVDQIVENIDVLDAYRRWIGKEVDEKTINRREGVMVSCPNPDHRDKHPSAWVNTDNRTWYCGGCAEGGDIYDLAAIHFNYDRPGYKDGATFHELRKEMAESYGYRFKVIAGKEVIWKEEQAADIVEGALEAAEEKSDTPTAPAETKVTVLREQDVEVLQDEAIHYPILEWKEIIPPDTFFYEYMLACTNDDSPEAYHFWH